MAAPTSMLRSPIAGLTLLISCCANAEQPATTLPGAVPFAPELRSRLEQARSAKGPGYVPRTRHLGPDGWAKYANRLFLESSPYLLQHAHNPVNWYPWSDAAFEEARRRGVPVLLSVGYSTCHWCHAMEEESFEDEEIARFLNENYVSIKVDREERPDVDGIYMSAVQALTGGGGWPMTVWLTPDRKPFFGGTYFPARDGDRGTRSGFLTLLKRLREVYERQPEQVASQAVRIAQTIQERLEPRTGQGELPGGEVLEAAADFYRSRFDATNGGLAGAPKFPSSLPMRFLLRHQTRAGAESSRDMALLTLERMSAGGMYDQIGGGFHRYSTDSRWLVPHFEKMLYDNALLAVAYLEGYQASGREDLARIAREILRYVERDMTSPDGAFYSATDADSLTPGGRREEGYFFTWTPAELERALGDATARILATHYGVTQVGNFEGRTILHVAKPLAELSLERGIPESQLRATVDAARETLRRERAKRPGPLRDEKILTAWNGLMISAYARAALVLGGEAYERTAERAADFVLGNLRRDGRLLRSYGDGRAQHGAYLEDYAFLTAALLDLFEVTGGKRWLVAAIELDAVLGVHYEDRERGGYFLTADDHEELLAREKPAYDGAEPSGNSVALMNLLRLNEFTADERYRQRAERTLKAFHGTLAREPAALSEMLLAVEFYVSTPLEIILVVPRERDQAAPFLRVLGKTLLPHKILVVVPEGQLLDDLARIVPLVARKTARKGRPTAYVCERGTCQLPTTDVQIFAEQLRRSTAD